MHYERFRLSVFPESDTRVAQRWLAFVATALVISCGSLQERIDELNQPTPQHLDSSPESTGLVIVDVGLKHKGSLSFGIESSVNVLDGVIRQADTRETIRQGTLKQLLVFQLPPGMYELVSVRGHFRSGDYYHSVEPFLVPEVGPIEVAAGQIAYVGKLSATAHSRIGQFGFTYSYEWDRHQSREAAALDLLEQQYTDSAWIPMLRKRRVSLLEG